MDLYQDDSGSDEESITLDLEQGDAVIVYGCNEQRYSPPPNHVTKVLIGPRETNPSIAEITIFTHDSAPQIVASGSTNHNVCSPFGPPEDHGVSSQTQVKPYYNELAETLSHLNVGGQGVALTSHSSVPVSPALSRKFRNSTRSEVNLPSKNAFLDNANASNTNAGVFPVGSSPSASSDSSKPAAIPTGTIPPAINQQAEATHAPPPVSSGNIIDPPGAFKSPDLLGHVAKSAASSTESPQVFQPAAKPLEDSISHSLNSESPDTSSTNITQANPPDVTQSQNSNTLSSKPPEPVVSNAIQLTPKHPDGSGPARIQILNAACSQELATIQESLNTPDQSESSFHFPQPPTPAPLVCVPVKEVKFEEPPKHQVVSALETLAEKLGEIVPITVQPGHTTQNVAKAKDEPKVIVLPTYSASQFQSKAKDNASAPQTTLDQASNRQTESKMNNSKVQEVVVPSDQAGQEEHEHSYGIIGNEDNLSEITLPPLPEGGANHHDGGPYNNGHPCHRIRISIDQQSATPSRRAMAITGLLIVLLISTIILLGVYKFVHKSSPD